MVDANRFLSATIETLAKRANLKCSNPYCGVATSGPHEDEERFVNTGVASHIRGAKPGSARYDPEMKPEERRTITNGIWLCQSCSKLIDSDARRFSVDVLYRWKREREVSVLNELGYEVGDREYRQRISRVFAHESPAAQQIALDQPDYWEHLLLVELLRSKLGRIEKQMKELERGLLYQPSRQYKTPAEFLEWLIPKFHDLQVIAGVIDVAIKEEINPALGQADELGDAETILQATNYIESACKGFLDFDKELVFSIWPEGMEDLHSRFKGWSYILVDAMQTYPKELAKVLEQPKPEGSYTINVVIDFPPEVASFLKEILERAGTLHNQ